jgi:hypothetical protein
MNANDKRQIPGPLAGTLAVPARGQVIAFEPFRIARQLRRSYPTRAWAHAAAMMDTAITRGRKRDREFWSLVLAALQSIKTG